jgi:hypothetical protein
MECIKCLKNIKKSGHCNDCFKRAQDSWDIQHMVNKDTSKFLRKRFDIWNIRSNTIKCKSCNTIIRSKNKHHYSSCKCWWCAVDWGSHYQRIMWDNYEIMVEKFDDKLPFNTFKENLLV